MLSSQAGLLALCEQHKELMIFEDYTFLITPSLRAVEAILKHILVLHGVRIGTGTGSHRNFSYVFRSEGGEDECKHFSLIRERFSPPLISGEEETLILSYYEILQDYRNLYFHSSEDIRLISHISRQSEAIEIINIALSEINKSAFILEEFSSYETI